MPTTPPTLDYSKPTRTDLWPQSKPLVLLGVFLILLEIACAVLAYHTIGGLVSGLYYLLIMLNIVPLLAGLVSRRLAVIGLLVIATLIIPYQLLLGVRWWRVQREADRIVLHLRSGAPASSYVFRDAGTRPFITIAPRPDTDVSYWIGSPSTSHWYDPKYGWLYYPD